MAYPSTIDSPTANVDNVDVIYASDVNELQTAVVALENKVGVNSSAVTTSHDYKLSGVATADKAVSLTGAEVLTNKTLSTGSKIALGSDATGDVYYNGGSGVLTRLPVSTDGKILKLASGVPSWATESTTVDASATAKGIVEIATAAEITAGTATGSTGAVLAISPDQLASSTPVFNGSGLTGISGKLNLITTDVTFSSSNAENTLLSYSVPANTLSIGNLIRVTMHITNLGVTSTNTATIRFKYGATTLVSKVYTATNSTSSLSGKIEFLLASAGTTGTQNGSYVINLAEVGLLNTAKTYIFAESAQGTSSEDSTASKTLAITNQFSNSSASDAINVSMIVIEVIR